MALVLKDRVLESSTSTGTGSFTLTGAQTGYQSFSAIGNGNTTYYTIQGKNADGTLTGEWEVGTGTYTTGSLSRDTVLESSNANSLVVFSAGAKDVFCDYPASKSVNQNADNKVIIPYTPGVTNVGSLNVGDATAHTDSGVIAAFTASEPLYLYTSLQNTSSANTSYASYAVNDGGHTSYGELGINNSNYSYTAAGYPNNTFSAPLATFFESYGGPLAIGTWDSQKISFIVNGSTNTADAMTISAAGTITIPSLTASQAVFTDASKNLVSKAVTGTGSVVLSDSPTFTTAITSTGALQLTGDSTTNQNIATTQTTGTLSIGGPSATGTIKLGQSTNTQEVDISNGVTASTKTNTIKLGTAGAVGSTTTTTIGSTLGTSTTVMNGNVGIGTSSPTRKVSVYGTTNAYQDFTASSYHRYTIGSEGQGFVFYDDTVGAYRMILDLNGNLGLSVTPSAWRTAGATKAIDISTFAALEGDTGGAGLWGGLYLNSSSQFIYKTSSSGGVYNIANTGQHQWYTVASGTAGAVATVTQAMTLFASGGLSLGNTTDSGAGSLNVSGNLQLIGSTTATQNIGTSQTSGTLNIGGAGTINVGATSASGIITIGRSSSSQSTRIADGSGVQTVNINRLGSSGSVVSIGSSDNGICNIQNGAGSNQEVNIASYDDLNSPPISGRTVYIGGGQANTKDIYIGTDSYNVNGNQYCNVTIGSFLPNSQSSVILNGDFIGCLGTYFKPPSLSSAPAVYEGAMYYDTTLHKLRICDNVGWKTITAI